MPVRACTHAGFAAVELTTPALRLVAVHGTGPRLAWLSLPQGENLLLWDEAQPPKYGREPEAKRPWTLRGGHRVWTARFGADEDEQTYANDDGAGTCETRADGFTVTGAPCGETRTQRSIRVRLLRDDRLEVVNRIENRSNMLLGCGLWGLTCTRPSAECRYVVPLGDGSSWDTATITVFRRWAGHGTDSFREEQGGLEDDAYVIIPKGRETKRMVQTPAGAIALVDRARDLTFAIRAPYERGAQYPAGANIALYVGPQNFMVEMETMGPFAVVKPGEALEHRQEWTLQRGAIAPTGAAVRAFTA